MSARPSTRTARLLVGALVLAICSPAHAIEPQDRLRVSWVADGAITGVSLAGWGISELASGALMPPACRWCTPPGFDSSARSALSWSNTAPATLASSVLVVTIPAGFALYDLLSARDVGGIRTSAEDVLVVAEAVAATGLLTQGVKYVVARQRPYAIGAGAPKDPDTRASFWSGHTSLAFAAAAAGGSVAEIRGYAGWPWVYAVGFTAAAGTGYLRLAGDRHWLSDVLAGAAAGTAVGFAVPWLHRGVTSGGVSVSVLPGGLAISGRL